MPGQRVEKVLARPAALLRVGRAGECDSRDAEKSICGSPLKDRTTITDQMAV
jgi:hypothetical protein